MVKKNIESKSSDLVIEIRGMTVTDLPFWVEIEEISFLNPWTVDDWHEFRSEPHNISVVVCQNACIVGYTFYVI